MPYMYSPGVHVLCVTSAWPFWTVPSLKSCFLVSCRKLSRTSWERWLDGQVETSDARLSSLNFSCGLGDPWKVFEQVSDKFRADLPDKGPHALEISQAPLCIPIPCGKHMNEVMSCQKLHDLH